MACPEEENEKRRMERPIEGTVPSAAVISEDQGY